MESFALGTGASIYTQKLIPAILSAQHEIILVTCFWARSKTLTAIRDALEQLARQRQSQQPAQALRIRVCFSSRSLFQKLLHTSSSDGYTYPPSAWVSKIGLPSPELLAAGNIDLNVKSIFLLPFSVMHPKFLIVDRHRAFVPSCNVSWEPWLEGCLELLRRESRDDTIDGLLDFYRETWERNFDLNPPFLRKPLAQSVPLDVKFTIKSPADIFFEISNIKIPATAIQWLPSPHHRNPRFCVFPWQTPTAPHTPLNDTLLRLFEEATRDVYIQTPNLTSPPVLSAVIETLARGVNVNIVTGRNMMVWEQILTAGTTTGWCVRSLTRRYKRLCKKRKLLPRSEGSNDVDTEAQTVSPGALKISYFRPASGASSDEEPVHSHLKLAIFDSEHTVLGSGNMERASWFTSQELGVLIQSVTFATAVKSAVDQIDASRVDAVFPSPR